MMRYWLYRFAAWVLPRMPETLGYTLFALAGDIVYLFARRTRRLMMDNMRRAMPPETEAGRLRWLTRQAFRNLLWNYYELFHLPGYQLGDLKQRVQFEGVEHVQAAWEAGTGKGGIVIFTHCGNMEVVAQIAVIYPHQGFLVITEHMKDERVMQLMSEMRASHGIRMVPVDRMLTVVRLLKQNWIVLVAGDRDKTHSGIVVDFFGRPARMPDGGVQLALRTGVPLFMAYGWREESRERGFLRTSPPTFRGRVLPIPLERSGDLQGDARRGVEQVIHHLETIIRSHPDQWRAFEPIWLEG